MEFKVYVEGIQRIVCGVTVNTTCQDIVFALAHATGKVGRFTLIERWRNNERSLAPNENPLKILLKWGEYANDVQFILQRSDQIKKDDKFTQQQRDTALAQSSSSKSPEKNSIEFSPLDRSKEYRKSFGSIETKQVENIGIVKGIPQKQSNNLQQQNPHQSPSNSPQKINVKHEKTPSSISLPLSNDDNSMFSANSNEINLAEVRNSLDRRTGNNLYQNELVQVKNSSNENLLDMLNVNRVNSITSPSSSPQQLQQPQISSNGALVPPPYRDPPPPRNSPLQKMDSYNNNSSSNSKKSTDNKDNMNLATYFNINDFDLNENVLQNIQYKDLIQLIKLQRDKINSQQADLTKYDAEIVYLESKERDQVQELESISREISKTDQMFRQGNEQLQTLQYVEEENELVKQQEKTLKSEITLLRSKLANCETELLQCKNKIRLLMDEIQIEQRQLSNRQKDNRQNVERNFLSEMERIQTEIDLAIQNTESSTKTTENLKKEIILIENAIAEKKRQVEQLVNEMKEVNLQSLTVTPSDEIRHLLEGSNRPGSTRRIIGSPRQLENAVPTSKNPHGVWV
ncbi:ras association domain-containing protein 8 [Condylostylus longicornis]|uniref:ras association domain-containing protein 8 n=1 Tax=Condylostylus longicornis TaxID=2530218 RepID=UPI00244E3237|nr:ras association domain-containing protein 8 [Condylostylus longicornis]